MMGASSRNGFAVSSFQLISTMHSGDFMGTCSQADQVAELMGSETTQSLFTERQTVMLRGALASFPLPTTVVIAGHEPDGGKCVQSHSLAVVNHSNGRVC